MARLSRKLRVCKWAGTVGCVLIVAAFVWSAWSEFRLQLRWSKGQDSYAAWLAGGDINFGPQFPVDTQGWELRLIQNSPRGWPLPDFSWLPGVWRGSPSYYSVYFPLWLPFLVLLIPTLLLWWRDRRRRLPGFCRSCDYDLTGNTSGRCPECGLEITA